MVYFLSDHWLALLLALAALGIFLRRLANGSSLRSARIAFPLALAVGHGIYRTSCSDADGREELWIWWASLSAGALALEILLLLAFRIWSYPAFALALLSLVMGCGVLVRPAQDALAVAYASLLGLHFAQPYWLLLLLGPLLLLPGTFRHLAGLGPRRRWLVLGLRASLLAAVALALAEPQLRKPNENQTVLFLLDRSLSIPTEFDGKTVDSAGVPVDTRWRRIQQFVNDAVAKRGPAHRNDRVGAILFGKRPRLVLPPGNVDKLFVADNLAGPIDGQYTDIASAIKLALASFPEGSAKRIVLVSDGNENVGSAEEQAVLAKQNGVPIDTILLAPDYHNDSEVMVQSIETPSRAAKGARLPLRVVMRNASPNRSVEGTLEILQSRGGRERPVPILPNFDVIETSPTAAKVRLRPGLTVFTFRDKLDTEKDGPDTAYSYKAIFRPNEELPGDRIQNNRAIAHVIARSQRKVLVLDAEGDEEGSFSHQNLIDQLRAARFKVFAVNVARLPQDKNELAVFLSDYDCVVLANVPAELLSKEQQETIRTNTYDQGCGLVVVGGPDSYGAGGYQKTPLEDALPVDCDIKAMKAAGKGGLVLIMHASELADGNKWQKEIAKLAIQKLSAVDMVGLLYLGGLKPNWHIPFQTVGGDRGRFMKLIDRMVPGDMPDFDPFLKETFNTLSDPDHGLTTRHCIIISDGDPALGPLGQQALAGMAKANITCTTVGVATHGANENTRMTNIAAGAAKGGRYYEVKDASKLPAIYIQETRRVSQSFLYDARFKPTLTLRGGPTDQLDSNMPDLYGFIRTTLKPSPLAEMLIEGPRTFDQRFPILAAWQYGLGRSVAFTSDARSRPPKVEGWDRKWAGADMYRKFWEQVVGWAMRGVETDRLTTTAEYRDGRIRWVVEARDEANRPITNLKLDAGVTKPGEAAEGKPAAVRFEQKSPGVYEAELKAEEAGTYLLNTVARQAANGYKGRIRDNLSDKVTEKGGKLYLDDGTEVIRTADGGLLYADDRKPVAETKGIERVIDSQRGAVTISYSPEFNDLESNPALMSKLSKMTGGTAWTEEDAVLKKIVDDAALFRPGPPGSRSLQGIWPWLVFFAGMAFFCDIGARRVTLDFAEVSNACQRLWTRLRTQRDVTEGSDEFLQRLKRKKVEIAESIDQERSGRKFEPEADAPLRHAPPPGADGLLDRPPPPVRKPEPKPEAADDKKDDFFGKLKKAKKRAGTDTDRPDEEKRL